MSPRYLDLKEEGQKLLQKNQFRSAKSQFDEALKVLKSLPRATAAQFIEVLDLRVQTYLRLKDWESALNDARSMIRRDRGDARGYLRCGQICRLKEDDPTARTWYQQGLKNIRPDSKSYEQLETMLNKVIAKIEGHKFRFRDPILCLSADLIYMVFGYLDYKQKVICLRVSRTWSATLPQLQGLWRTVELDLGRREVSLTTLRSCLGRLSIPPRALMLGRMSPSAGYHLRNLIGTWKTVEHLSLNSYTLPLEQPVGSWPNSLKSVSVGPNNQISSCEVQDMLLRLTNLEQASFSGVIIHGNKRNCPIDCKQRAFKDSCRLPVPRLKHLELTMFQRDQSVPRTGYEMVSRHI